MFTYNNLLSLWSFSLPRSNACCSLWIYRNAHMQWPLHAILLTHNLVTNGSLVFRWIVRFVLATWYLSGIIGLRYWGCKWSKAWYLSEMASNKHLKLKVCRRGYCPDNTHLHFTDPKPQVLSEYHSVLSNCSVVQIWRAYWFCSCFYA